MFGLLEGEGHTKVHQRPKAHFIVMLGVILPVVICQAKVITAGYFISEPCAVHVLKRC